ncbi:putative thymidylate kinase [Scenedesmus sp. NREL 46B-D3]|nr:putative thymidylate kinase [Scenedesmus sp. NREL 46B-D3]
MAAGPLIVFEGIDRSGKSTQVHMLADALRAAGLEVECLRFPDRASPLTGALVDSFLKGHQHGDVPPECMELIFGANRREKAAHIAQRLAAGCTLLIDRYVDSGAAYGTAQGMDATWSHNLDAGMPEADLVIFLDLPAAKAGLRAGFGSERFERVEFLSKVRNAYMHLRGPRWYMVDADRPACDVHADVVKAVLGQ